jgi:hypothetical protein
LPFDHVRRLDRWYRGRKDIVGFKTPILGLLSAEVNIKGHSRAVPRD